MKLEGRVYNFGERSIGSHLRAIAEELDEQAFVNGEDDNDAGEEAPLLDLSFLLKRVAAEVDKVASRLAC